jgi:hypothetical protein
MTKASRKRLAFVFLPGCGLQRLHALGLKTLGALHDLKLHGLAFLKAAEAVALNRRVMNEDIGAGLAADEAEALRIVKPLHCSLFHCACPCAAKIGCSAKRNLVLIACRAYSQNKQRRPDGIRTSKLIVHLSRDMGTENRISGGAVPILGTIQAGFGSSFASVRSQRVKALSGLKLPLERRRA